MYTDEDFFNTLNMILDQQIGDIEKALEAHANMLCLVGCMNVIEFMGGVLNGKLGFSGESQSRFKAGIDLLSEAWKEGIFAKTPIIFDEDDLWDLRCSLTHQYTAKVPKYQAVMVIGTEHKDILFQYSEENLNGTRNDRLIVSVPVMGTVLEILDARKKTYRFLKTR